MCASFHFNHRAVTVRAQMRIALRISESSELRRGQSPWHPKTSPLQSDEASSPPMASHRHPWAAGLVPDSTFITVLKRSLNEGDISTSIFKLSSAAYFLKNPVLCWADLSRSCDQYTISPPTDTGTLIVPRQCILTQRCWRWSFWGTWCCLSPRLKTVRKQMWSMA